MKNLDDLDNLIPLTKGNSEVQQIIKNLFSNRRKKANSIASKDFFDRYFSLELLANDISELEFINALQDVTGELLIVLNKKNSPVLLQKLNQWINDNIVGKQDELSSYIEALLSLFDSVLDSKNLDSVYFGINTSNLRTLIVSLYKKSDVPMREKYSSFLSLLRKDRKRYLHVATLLELDVIFLLGETPEQRRELFTTIRTLQLDYLRRSINLDIIQHVIRIVQILHRFISQKNNSLPNEDDVSWFIKNVIDSNAAYFAYNLKNIYVYIVTVSTINDQLDREFARQMIDSIFHDVDVIDKFNRPYINYDAEDLLDLREDFNIIEESFIFNNQVPILPGNTDHNDHFYKSNANATVFNTYNTRSVKIFIDPNGTEFWRLGFRFSQTPNFPPIEDDRHQKQYPIVHISKGHPVNATNGNWHSDGYLWLTDYFKGEGAGIMPHETGEKIILRVDFLEASLSITVKTTKNKIEKIVSYNSDEFPYFIVSAWCDSRSFKIFTKIKVKKYIDPN